MIEYTTKRIINYIKNDIGISREGIEERSNKELKWVVEAFFRDSQIGISKEESNDFLKLINELKEIREVYQKGKSFVKNQKEGNKKGSPKLIYSILKYYVKKGEFKKAEEEAKKHLEHTRNMKSERTYYRHLKKIREVGVQI